jgi:hypothetical protein
MVGMEGQVAGRQVREAHRLGNPLDWKEAIAPSAVGESYLELGVDLVDRLIDDAHAMVVHRMIGPSRPAGQAPPHRWPERATVADQDAEPIVDKPLRSDGWIVQPEQGQGVGEVQTGGSNSVTDVPEDRLPIASNHAAGGGMDGEDSQCRWVVDRVTGCGWSSPPGGQ